MNEPFFPKALRGVLINGTDSYDLLPPEIKAMHHVQNALIAKGSVDITRGASCIAKLTAKCFGFPNEGNNIPAVVTFSKTPKGERLTRNYNGESFTSYFYDYPEPGHMIERFGPFWFLIKCLCNEQGIDMIIQKFWLWKIIPLPLCLAPKIDATERAVDGKYLFDVDIRLPLIGRIIHYRGWLIPDKTED